MPGSIADLIRTHRRDRPDATALRYDGRTISFAELDDRSSRLANGLLACGVGPQDRVSYLGRNSPEYLELLFGGAKINAVAVGVNWRLAPTEIACILQDAQSRVLLVEEEFVSHVHKIEHQLSSVSEIIAVSGEGLFRSYEAWLGSHPPTDPAIPASPDDVALQMYTSGTTGLPRGAMLTNRGLFTFLADYAQRWNFTSASVHLVSLPVFHMGGTWWVLIGMQAGATTVLVREANPATILEAIRRFRVTNTTLVPAIIQSLLDTPGSTRDDLASLTTLVYGGSPISDDVLRRASELLTCRLIQVYGLTEAVAVTELTDDDHDPRRRPDLQRSCGRPLPWVEVQITDPQTAEPVPPGTIGEVWVRGDQNMAGYWGQPDATAATLTPDGWLRTGDAGTLDEDGYLFLQDRIKDMIISGAENVYPAEVENVLMGHPAVSDVAVIAVPHPRWGETVKAIVVLKAHAEASEQQLIRFCREHLAHFKCPTSIDFTAELPRTPSGKVLKRQLREPYWIEQPRRIS